MSKMAVAQELLRFVDAACTPYHAVDVAARMLREAGCTQLHEHEDWHDTLTRGGRYFVTRNGSSIVAFAVGGAGVRGAKIVGAHTDSPNLALKPRVVAGKASDAYVRVGVQCYGGGLWHTWFDRDLTVAGRIVRRTSTGDGAALATQLVRLDKPLLRIASLAIHLRTQAERDAFALNKEQHLVPILATATHEQLACAAHDAGGSDPTTAATRTAPAVLRAVAAAAQCAVDDIIDFDLSVIDTQPSVVGGMHDEFVFAPRLDNLLSCFCALRAFVRADGVERDDMARILCLFDHEEVGSTSAHGAGSSLLPDVIERLRTARGIAADADGDSTRAAFAARSFLLSIDGAHASHPCYADKHEDAHRPVLHGGPVIKYNANMRYATNGATAAVIKLLAQRAQVPVQEFVVRNDSPCGSTIGPMLSALSGVRAADIGNAMLSMHSIREMCGVDDVDYLERLIVTFLTDYRSDMVAEAAH